MKPTRMEDIRNNTGFALKMATRIALAFGVVTVVGQILQIV